MLSATIFLAAHVFSNPFNFQQQIYILSKNVKTISSRENPTRRRAGGKRKKKVCHTVHSIEQTLVVKGLGQGLTNKWQEMTDVEETPQRDLMLIGARLWMWQPWYHLSALEATHMERTLYILVILNKQHLQTPDRTPLSALSDLICPSIGGVWVCVKRELRQGSWQGWIIRKAQMLDVPTCS